MRYILCPDYVLGGHGDINYVDAPTLANLYRVRYEDCEIFDWRRPDKSRGYRPQKDDVMLHVRYDGNYQLPQTQSRREEP